MPETLFPTSKSIKSLRGYYQDKLNELDVESIRSELFAESDRAKIILVSALLEDLLDYRLEESIAIEPSGRQGPYIFRFDGPLGRFAYKTEIAYIFGFISLDTAKQLNIIREMRNACAHSKFKLSFDMPILSNVAKTLFKPLGFMHLKDETPEAIRSTFLAEIPILLHTLIQGSREAAIACMRANLADFAAAPFPLPDK
jgi:hypothetical protein